MDEKEYSEFTFKYTGTSEIEVGTLIESLKDISNSLKIISESENGPPLDVKIKPFKEGSFEWIFTIEPVFLAGVSMLYSSIPGDGIIDKFKSTIELITFFKGEEISEPTIVGENIYQFTNESGEVKIVENDYSQTYSNPGVVYNIQNLYVTVNQNANIDGFNLEDKNKKPIVNVNKKEIKEVAETVEVNRRNSKITELLDEEVARVTKKEQVNVSVIKPDLAGKSVWKVVFEGYKTDIKIADEKFQADVSDGKVSFTNGTSLTVDLEIKQTFDTTINAYVNKVFTVTKVYDVNQPIGQASLFGN